MNFKQIIFLFFISVLTISNVSANEYILDFENILIDSYQNQVNTENVAVEKPLAIKVTLANPNDFWIKIDSLQWIVKSKKNNDDFDVIVKQKYEVDTKTKPITEIIIPPNSKINLYIILDHYNSLEEDERIGSWLIDLEEQLVGLSYYQEDSLNEIQNNYYNPINLRTSKGNLIQFTVTKEPVKITKYGFFNYIPGLKDINPYLDFIGSIVSILAALGVINWIKNR